MSQAPENPAVAEALKFVGELAGQDNLAAAHRDRLLQLISSPDSLAQGGRGICAMTSVVHTLLNKDLDQFRFLLEAVYHYWDDVPVGRVEVNAPKLQQKLVKQVGRKYRWAAGDEGLSEDLIETEADFVLARALGKVLKQASPATFNRLVALNEQSFFRLFNAETDFIVLNVDVKSTPDVLRAGPTAGILRGDLQALEPVVLQVCGYGINLSTLQVTETKKSERWQVTWKIRGDTHHLLFTQDKAGMKAAAVVSGGARSEGDLGFDAAALCELMTVVYGSNCRVLLGTQPQTVTTVNQVLARPKGFAYGMVNGVVNWWAAHSAAQVRRPGSDPAFMFDGPPKTATLGAGMVAPPAEHVVVITGPITESGDLLLVPVWTWSERFTVRVPRTQLAAYFPQFVCGVLR
jgi:hypothetical protein